MKLVYFTHSLRSCWNHGNAHFLRGVLREFALRGDDVVAMEPEAPWSLQNLEQDHGPDGLRAFREAYPELAPRPYGDWAACEETVADADVVVVHEWNEPALVAFIGRLRRQGGRFTLLFHDTHHRAVSDSDAIRAFDLSGYDGVLAFGETLSEVYRRWGWGRRVWTWHEAADVRHFHPPVQEGPRRSLTWIGNWGDGERSEEIESLLLQPARDAGIELDIHGVRYPDDALAKLEEYGARFRGWLPNAAAPAVFARHIATVHVPRRFYVTMLPGIPTIRVFEALACGIPLVSAPWQDSENLFRPGEDFLTASDGDAMTRHLRALRHDPELRAALVKNGLTTIRARHSCNHRMHELLAILSELRPQPMMENAA
ncbi:CgeB family protein [Roseococcus sp. YIM B11640]|uniref:CgeB family protein n=1 Tax=Roseococcus sp. YIM B11640 TaxID=3133973 RepID=UPI003C7C7F5D